MHREFYFKVTVSILPKNALRHDYALAIPVTHAPVAQLDRVPDYGSGGWGFESSRARHYCLSDCNGIISLTTLMHFDIVAREQTPGKDSAFLGLAFGCDLASMLNREHFAP